jgi:hypothetical protein
LEVARELEATVEAAAKHRDLIHKLLYIKEQTSEICMSAITKNDSGTLEFVDRKKS